MQISGQVVCEGLSANLCGSQLGLLVFQLLLGVYQLVCGDASAGAWGCVSCCVGGVSADVRGVSAGVWGCIK